MPGLKMKRGEHVGMALLPASMSEARLKCRFFKIGLSIILFKPRVLEKCESRIKKKK